MDDTASAHVYHDIGVVSIFNLQNVANQRVGCQRSSEAVHRLIIFLRRLGTVFELNLVELNQINVPIKNLDELLFNLIDAHGVGTELKEAAILSCGQNIIGSKLKIKPSLFPDLVHGFDQLHRELLGP